MSKTSEVRLCCLSSTSIACVQSRIGVHAKMLKFSGQVRKMAVAAACGAGWGRRSSAVSPKQIFPRLNLSVA